MHDGVGEVFLEQAVETAPSLPEGESIFRGNGNQASSNLQNHLLT
jgi:hypothetical protein